MAEEYPDLGFDDDDDEDYGIGQEKVNFQNPMSPKKFKKPEYDILPDPNPCEFVSTPALVHYGGFKVQETHVQVVTIVNRAKASRRLQILPPTTEFFKISYQKCGMLAAGMSIKISIKFIPSEYIYYYDCLRITSESQNLVVPIHAYPMINKIEFPKYIAFGDVALCEPISKKFSLRCSVPVDFGFHIEISRPHPYFKVEPVKGIIPGNGSIDIKITYSPITLGTNILAFKLVVAQHGFEPLLSEVSARGVSGIVENRLLNKAEHTLEEYIDKVGSKIVGRRPKKTMLPKGSSSLSIGGSMMSSIRQSSTSLGLNSESDPVAGMLAKTFASPDLTGALESVVSTHQSLASVPPSLSHDIHENALPGHHIPIPKGFNKPKGPGAGAVFDAGAQWMTQQHKQRYLNGTLQKATINLPTEKHRVIDGIKVPVGLNNTTAVNYVLTQVPGKLKPQDLKTAIDGARAEREQRAEDQAKIRNSLREGSSDVAASTGAMDVNALLAEERMNIDAGDPYKRQMREMAFLVDLEELQKVESEKTFRISEEFLGSDIISSEDISLVLAQREETASFKRLKAWKESLSRVTTHKYPANHPTVKAGVSSSLAKALNLHSGIPSETKSVTADATTPNNDSAASKDATVKSVAVDMLKPSFDVNSNDVWAKRLRTLRRFVSVISRFIVYRRAAKRLEKIKKFFADTGAKTREEVKAAVETENQMQASVKKPIVARKIKNISEATTKENTSSSNPVSESAEAVELPKASAAMVICSMPDAFTETRKTIEHAMASTTFTVDSNMIHRILFPFYRPDDSTSRLELSKSDLQDNTVVTGFNDLTFIPLKVRPDYQTLGYTTYTNSINPVRFSTSVNKPLRHGAREEYYQRLPVPVAEYHLHPPSTSTSTDETSTHRSIDDQVAEVVDMASGGQSNLLSLSGSSQTPQSNKDLLACPEWLLAPDSSSATAAIGYSEDERDFFRPRQDYRLYMPDLPRTEIDFDWILRPQVKPLEYTASDSLRDKLLSFPGFQAANTYLLASQETRFPPTTLPPPGPTITDYYNPDVDRHSSGLFTYENDFKRALLEPDPDLVSPYGYRTKNDREDILSDSESDDEEMTGSGRVKPSLALVRNILTTKPPVTTDVTDINGVDGKAKGKVGAKGGDAKGKGKAVVSTSTPPSSAPANEATLASDLGPVTPVVEDDSKPVQIDLLRDRKTLDLERHMSKTRKTKFEEFPNKLVELSTSSKCAIQALPVQLPFHMYEEEVYKLVEPQMPKPLKSYISL